MSKSELLNGFIRNNIAIIFFKEDGGINYYKDVDGNYYYSYKDEELYLENIMDKEFMKIEIPFDSTKRQAFEISGRLYQIDINSLQILQLLDLGREINSILDFDRCIECTEENCGMCNLIHQNAKMSYWDSKSNLRNLAPAIENPWVFVARINEVLKGEEK